METKMTEGNIMRIILRFMMPLLLGNVFQQLYNMADSIIVGNFVGAHALAGVGSTGTIMFFVNGITIGMTTGFSVLTSQKFGAGNEEETRRSVANGIILAAMVSIIMILISLTAMPTVLHLMNTPDSIYQEAYTYITIICSGLFATMYYNLFSSYMRAIGNSRIPLYFLIFSACLNVVLDLFFIIIFRWGVAGAARATILSQGLSAILCLTYIIRKVPTLRPSRNHWRLNMEDTRTQLAIGVPMAAQFGITASGTMVMQSAINRFEEAIAVYTAANKVQSLLIQGGISMGQTMASYSGQNYGAGDLGRIHQGTKDGVKIMVVYSLLSGAFAIFCLPNLLHLFFSPQTDVAALLPWARTYIHECVICYIPLGMIFVYRNTMQGCGYGIEAMSMGFVELAARMSTAILSMKLNSYALAVGCDPMAWLTGGIYGFILYLTVKKRMEKKFNHYPSNLPASR
ncbi:MAG: MATE family efflux transporter [Eubacterium sp.]|nr:MATE family efflux transporter [Eubacterium sp.]